MANDKTTPAATAEVKTATTEKRTRKLTAIFRPPYTKKDGTASTIASMDLLGCFGAVPMAIKDFALSVPRNGQITVYMPSGMYGAQRVGPVGGEMMSDADVAAEATTMSADEARTFIARHRAKKAATAVLADAILAAWGSFPAGTDNTAKFGVPVTIELPE